MTALENMAAAARQPGLGDARVPCPLCGGLIHPVAGRCKHCKEDLTQFRAGRPQAAAALPPLNGAGSQPVPVPAPAPQVSPWAPPTHANGAAAAPVPVAVPTAREGSQPILPQRPTGRSMAVASPTTSLWRSWPMIVIGVAVLAIVTAVVIMVLPEDTKGSSKKIGTPPPAPERMDLDPMPPKASQLNPGDPWSQPDPGAQPQQPPRPTPPPDPSQPDPNDPNDLFGGLGGGAGITGSAVMLTVFDKACNKLKTCPDIDQSMISTVCDQFASMPKPPAPKNCPAAQRCFDAIDGMSCSQASSTSPLTAIYLIKDCTSAMNDC
jgi:hypothetical protein